MGGGCASRIGESGEPFGEKSKAFFSEEKKQKTFGTLSRFFPAGDAGLSGAKLSG
jgi:hypothetical protein